MNPESKPSKPQRYILLDTNIFEHLGNSELYPQIINILRDAIGKGYGFSMSIFTLLELIDTASVENEIKAIIATNGVKRFKINQTILIAAGHMGCLYKDDGIDVKKQPEKGDKIIAATSLVNNAVIFTTNGRDFPSPFFNTISKPLLKYTKSDGREVYLVSYFMEPDAEVIGVKHGERIKEHERKTTLLLTAPKQGSNPTQ